MLCNSDAVVKENLYVGVESQKIKYPCGKKEEKCNLLARSENGLGWRRRACCCVACAM